MNIEAEQHVLYTKVIPEMAICKLHWSVLYFCQKLWGHILTSVLTEFNLEFPGKSGHFTGMQLFKTKLNVIIKKY